MSSIASSDVAVTEDDEDLENEAQNLEAQLTSMALEVQDELTKPTNQTAPIASLPNELLAYIFHLYHASFESIDDSLKVARVLSRVCVHWRVLANGLPGLWSSIDVTSDLPPKILSLYLKRSGTHLLDLSLFHWSPTKQIQKSFKKHIAQLVPLARRWRRLQIFAEFGVVSGVLDTVHAPNLEYLHLGITTGPLFPHNELLTGGAASLREVSFRGFGPPLIHIPFSAVTRLCLERLSPRARMNVNEFRELMQSVPALTELALCKHILRPSREMPGEPIALPRLLLLELRGTQDLPDRVLPLLLRAPLLHTLVVREGTVLPVITPVDLTARFPALRTLVAVHCEPHVVDAVRRLESIEHLVCMHMVHDALAAPEMYEPFAHLAGDPLPLPGLRTLTVTPVDDLEPLHSIVAYRADSGRPLAEVCIPRVYDGGGAPELKWLSERVTVTYSDKDDF